MLATLVFVTACSDNPVDGDDERVTVNGSWTGEVVNGDQAYPVSVTIQQNDQGQLAGSGTVEVAGEDRTFTITSGDYFHPLLTATLIFDRPPLGKLDGTVNVDRDVIEGTLSGPGFAGPVELTLRRGSS